MDQPWAAAWEARALNESAGAPTMKISFCLMILVLSACAAVTPPRQHTAARMHQSPPTSAAETITGEELRRTGRTELSDALRASWPIFH